MPLLFAATLFVSATLLFLVQPMIAKMILPKFGGTPAVWNTCMVFFQALLLAGYSYAHAATAWLGVRKQSAVQLGLLLLPAVALPLAVRSDPPGDGNPIVWLLFLLLISVGIPFFVISTSAPLLQKWFAHTGHAAAKDPYFLYAASNVGSMLSLIAYPLWMERTFRLGQQSWIWTGGYALLVALTACCAYALRQSAADADAGEHERAKKRDRDTAPSTLCRLHWVALAFVPSSLMLGVTTYLSTDIAAIPLIWVIPLALYLLSFILVFAKLPNWVHTFMVLSLPVLVLLQMYLMLSESSKSMVVLIALHLATLFVAAMVCHGELARNRPDTRHLTEFYLWMSLGGVLGGIFNALVAPLLFKTIIEYPIVMVAACLLMPQMVGPQEAKALEKEKADGPYRPFAVDLFNDLLVPFLFVANLFGGRLKSGSQGTINDKDICRNPYVPLALDLVLPLLLGLLTFGLITRMEFYSETRRLMESLQKMLVNFIGSAPEWYRLKQGLMYGVPTLLCYAFVNRPLRFGLGVGAVMLAGGVYAVYFEEPGSILLRHRSFFGVLKLEKSAANYHRLVHGTTLHGKQRIDPQTGLPLRDWFYVSPRSLQALGDDALQAKLQPLAGKSFSSEKDCLAVLENLLSAEELAKYQDRLLTYARGAEPLTYYHRTGPVGQLMAAFREAGKSGNLALIGLGTGSLAAYGETGQSLTYFEIDQAVVDIAQNERYFSYWTDAKRRGAQLDLVLGDARLSLKNNQDGKAPDGHFQLIVVDAFSSDAIPVHLITREALQLYLNKLAPHGIIAFHISNRYLDLEPVCDNLARDAQLKAIVRNDKADEATGKAGSTWVLLARAEADFLSLRDDIKKEVKDDNRWYRFEDDARWHPKRIRPHVGVWSDDFSNILSVFMW